MSSDATPGGNARKWQFSNKMRGPTYKLIMRKTCDYARAGAQIEKLITRNRPVRKLKTRRVTTRVVSSKEPTYCKFPCWSLSLCCELRAVATTNHTVRRLSFSTAEVAANLRRVGLCPLVMWGPFSVKTTQNMKPAVMMRDVGRWVQPMKCGPCNQFRICLPGLVELLRNFKG